jgi:hypothetical protein
VREKSLFPKEIKAYHQLTQDNRCQLILGFLGLICLLLILPHIHEALLSVNFVNNLMEETLADLSYLALGLLLPCLHPLVSVDLSHQGIQSLECGSMLVIRFQDFEKRSKGLRKWIASSRSFGGVPRSYSFCMLCAKRALSLVKLLPLNLLLLLVSILNLRVSALFELPRPSLQLLVMRVKVEVSVTLRQLLKVQCILESRPPHIFVGIESFYLQHDIFLIEWHRQLSGPQGLVFYPIKN